MLSVALTGGIGCGKSTVCDLFSQLNVPIIDTDLIAHQLVQPGTTTLNKITTIFGSVILMPDGSLNRKKLADNIFNNSENREKLESILHPEIRERVKQQLNSTAFPYAIIDIPLLIETSQQSQYNRILVVDCDEQQQIDRILQRDQRSKDEINAIMMIQISRKKRLCFAHDIIKNTQDVPYLKKQVENLHQKYLHLANQM